MDLGVVCPISPFNQREDNSTPMDAETAYTPSNKVTLTSETIAEIRNMIYRF